MPTEPLVKEKPGHIDEEFARFIEEAYQRVLSILSERRSVMDDLTSLLSKEKGVPEKEL